MEPPIPPAMRDAHRRSASDFAELAQAIRQAGLLDRRPGHYAVRVALTLAVLAGAWTVFVWLGDTWWQVVGLSYGWWVARHSRLVRAFCAARGVAYQESGLLRSYGDVLRHLHAVGAPLRASAR